MLLSELAINVLCTITTFTFPFTLQSHLNKLARVILDTHISLSPFYMLKEDIHSGKTKIETQYEHMKIIKIFLFPVLLLFNIQDSLSSSCDWTKFCLPCKNCNMMVIITYLPKQWSDWKYRMSLHLFFLLLFVPISLILVQDRDNSGFHQQLQPDWILRKSIRYIWTAKIIFAL